MHSVPFYLLAHKYSLLSVFQNCVLPLCFLPRYLQISAIFQKNSTARAEKDKTCFPFAQPIKYYLPSCLTYLHLAANCALVFEIFLRHLSVLAEFLKIGEYWPMAILARG